MEWRGARLTAYPASHIVGAAQLLVEFQGERIVYTGDIKLRDPICGSHTEPVRCDRLIIESTFGLPIYRFLSRDDASVRIVNFARECMDDRITPVFMGYPLGRGQEIAFTLCQAGIPTAIHGSIARMIPVYEEAGFAFPNWFPYNAKETEGKALVVVAGVSCATGGERQEHPSCIRVRLGRHRQRSKPGRRRGTDRLFGSR